MLRVEVEWVDSGTMTANDQWTPTQTILDKEHIGSVTTVGHLLQFKESSVLVGLSYDTENDTWFGVQAIETSSIRKISILRARQTFEPEMFDRLRARVV